MKVILIAILKLKVIAILKVILKAISKVISKVIAILKVIVIMKYCKYYDSIRYCYNCNLYYQQRVLLVPKQLLT